MFRRALADRLETADYPSFIADRLSGRWPGGASIIPFNQIGVSPSAQSPPVALQSDFDGQTRLEPCKEQRSTVQACNCVGDGKAQAVAGFASRPIQTPKGAQHLGDLGLGHARAVVRDCYDHDICLRCD